MWLWLWLWHRLAAVTTIQPLAWELPYAVGVDLKNEKKKKFKLRRHASSFIIYTFLNAAMLTCSSIRLCNVLSWFCCRPIMHQDSDIPALLPLLLVLFCSCKSILITCFFFFFVLAKHPERKMIPELEKRWNQLLHVLSEYCWGTSLTFYWLGSFIIL